MTAKAAHTHFAEPHSPTAESQGRPAMRYSARAGESVEIDEPSTRRVGMRPTGFASAECSLAIGPDGTLVIGPAFGRAGNGVIRSRDGGETWELRIPDDGSQHRRIQPFTYIDGETGRLFFKNARFDVMPPNFRGSGYDLSVSDDLGDTWRHQVVLKSVRDWTKVISGPAPATDPDPRRITYLTGPAPFSTRVVPVAYPDHQAIRRSRDGGDTWEKAGSFPLRPRQVGQSRWELVIYGNGRVAPNGHLVIGGRRGRELAIAVSDDAGDTWTERVVPGAKLHRYHGAIHFVTLRSNYLLAEPVAIDDAGNLFAIWPDTSDILHGAWSADEGRTWSDPVVVSAPGVTDTRIASVVAKDDGRVAIAYYGRDRSRGRGYHVHLAETMDFRASAPVFTGGTIDPPGQPVYPRGFDPGYLRIMLGGDLNEMLQVRYAADGMLFVAAAMTMVQGNRRHRFDPASRKRHLQAVLGYLTP